jgi:hypothetical protein
MVSSRGPDKRLAAVDDDIYDAYRWQLRIETLNDFRNSLMSTGEQSDEWFERSAIGSRSGLGDCRVYGHGVLILRARAL